MCRGYVFDRYNLLTTRAENSKQYKEQVSHIIYPVGDGGVFSSANDMLKWDQALKTGKLLDQSLVKALFISFKTNDSKDVGYGFGWFIYTDSLNKKMVQHTGGWPGFKNAFVRYLDDNRTLLVFRNNEMDFKGIQPAVINILDNKPFRLPEPSLAQALALSALKAQHDTLIITKKYESLKDHCTVNEDDINTIGYGLLYKGMTKQALEVMKINASLFPNSANAFDSLAELYLKNGYKELAAINYRKSLALNPANDAAKKILETL